MTSFSMLYAPAALSETPEAPFQYVGGDLSIDLVNTVDWTGTGLEHERITSYDRLTRWAEGAGALEPATAERLRKAALDRPREAQAAYETALSARWVLRRVLNEVAAGSSQGSALAHFNDLLGETLRHLRIGRERDALGWSWRGMGDDLTSLLWPVIWSAARLLASDERSRIRTCGGADCGWMYVDRSRNHLRRWCQMETCGTRAKSRRRSSRAGRGRARAS